MRYKDYQIVYRPKQIPTNDYDYDYGHDDYDGAPDAFDNRCGCCGSIEQCKKEIDLLIGGNEL